MKKMLAVLAAVLALSCAALAVEPLLLDTTRNGNRYYLTGYEQSEGRIKVVLRCVFSDEEWIKTVAQLAQQGVPAADARKMVCNEYSLRYSADGTRYQRLYDRYLDAEGFTVRNLNQNPDAWYDTPSQPQQLPARALLEAGRLLGVPVKLPQAAQDDNGDAASLQSRSAPRTMSVAVATASYRADKKLFAANYENAFMRLSGVRGSVTRERGQLALILQPQNGGQGVVCLFSEDVAAKLKRIAQGAPITVEGVYRRGKTSKGAFVLETCEIVSK